MGVEPISLRDVREFENLLPTVAEMIKQADEVKYVGDLSSNISLKLHSAKDRIARSTKEFEERDVAAIHSAMGHVVNQIDAFME